MKHILSESTVQNIISKQILNQQISAKSINSLELQKLPKMLYPDTQKTKKKFQKIDETINIPQETITIPQEQIITIPKKIYSQEQIITIPQELIHQKNIIDTLIVKPEIFMLIIVVICFVIITLLSVEYMNYKYYNNKYYINNQ